MRCEWWTTPMWRKQAEIKWSRRGIFIVAWCNSEKLCALAAQPFQSQQSGALTRMWRWCQVQPSQKERARGEVHCKNEGTLLDLSVSVALKAWYSYAQYMKMTRPEHVFVFKSCDISIHWWIWVLSFLLKQNWIGIDYFLLNFFATFASVLRLQIIVTFGSALGLQVTVDCRLTVDCSHRHAGSHLLQAQCCVARDNQRKSWNDNPQHNSNWGYSFDQVRSSIAATNSMLYVA